MSSSDRCDYSATTIQRGIREIDVWKFTTDRAWRSAKDEPWLLWSQWAPQLWPLQRAELENEKPARILTRENILIHGGGNNFWQHWGKIIASNPHALSPQMWRFRREHPALDARLREAGRTRDMSGSRDLLWEAYQILSSPAYDDLRDRDNPHASYYG